MGREWTPDPSAAKGGKPPPTGDGVHETTPSPSASLFKLSVSCGLQGRGARNWLASASAFGWPLFWRLDKEEAPDGGLGASSGSVWGGTWWAREGPPEGIVCPQCVPIATLGVYPLAACCRPTLATLPHSPGCEIRATTFGGTVRGRSGISAGLSFCALPSQEKRQAPRGIGYPISPGRFLLSLVIGCTRIVG